MNVAALKIVIAEIKQQKKLTINQRLAAKSMNLLMETSKKAIVKCKKN